VDFTGKVALVTGAGSGIGEATALLLAERGCKVGLLGRSEDELGSVADQIQRKGGEDLKLVADISRAEQMKTAVETLIDRWGRLDIVFANAGINGLWAPVEDLVLEEWQKTIDINLTGTFITVQTCVPFMKESGGAIIITSSINGTRVFSNTGATAYSTTKAGQVAMTKMLALELAKHRIRVNVVCPGWIDTNIDQNTERKDLEEIKEPVEYPEGTVPLTDGAPGQPRQVAQLVAFLASDEADLITGTEVWIDGATSLLQG
jgi:NAD(P)-dependent dehydrogenase (short-subunit alcohol dehydrogenase family)